MKYFNYIPELTPVNPINTRWQNRPAAYDYSADIFFYLAISRKYVAINWHKRVMNLCIQLLSEYYSTFTFTRRD